MKKVIDYQGNIVPNTFLTEAGGLMVNDKQNLSQYLLQKNKIRSDAEKMESLEQELREIKNLLLRLPKVD